MDSTEVRDILRFHHMFRCLNSEYVVGEDELPSVVSSKPAVFIVNTKKRKSKTVGHWVCILFEKNSRDCYFFDPMGHLPIYYSESFQSFMFRNSDSQIYASSQIIQTDTDRNCGLYCLWYAGNKLSEATDWEITLKIRTLTLDEVKRYLSVE